MFAFMAASGSRYSKLQEHDAEASVNESQQLGRGISKNVLVKVDREPDLGSRRQCRVAAMLLRSLACADGTTGVIGSPAQCAA